MKKNKSFLHILVVLHYATAALHKGNINIRDKFSTLSLYLHHPLMQKWIFLLSYLKVITSKV